jgi:hypothetical protein
VTPKVKQSSLTKSKRTKSLLPRGWHSKGKGSAIARKAGPLATLNMYSRLAEAGVGSVYKQEAARARQLGVIDEYRAMFDYRCRPKAGLNSFD